MKTIVLTDIEREELGFTHKLVLTAADVLDKTSGTAFAVFPKLAGADTMPAGLLVKAAAIRLITACSKSTGTLTAATLSIGDGGSGTRYINAFDVLAGVASSHVQSGVPYAMTAADNIKATLTITGTATMAQLTNLEAHVYLSILDLNEFDKLK
jgi:hypothetical protein